MGSEYHNEDFDGEAQQAARDAIMEMPLFPDLTVQLRDALEYGPHCDMLQHFVYWFHPRHPKMQKRWTMYKTYTEWREECGLARKQVDKGRARLRELGLVTEKKGPHGRVHYQVDWVALAEDLSLSPCGEQTDEFDEWFDDDLDENSLSPYGEQGQFVPQGEQSSLSPYGEQANTGDYAEDYVTGNSTLQVATKINKNGKTNEFSPPPIEDKRHFENDGTSSADIAAKAVKDEVEEVVAPPKPDNDTLLADVRKILNPDSGRWWAARIVLDKSYCYAPEVAARHMLLNVGDIEGADAISEAKEEELTQVVAYVMWEATEEGRACVT